MTHDTQPSILIVEGDAMTAERMRAILRRAGYDASWAASAEEAYEAAIRQQPVLIICDAVLPGADGYALVRRLRRHAATRITPILLLTDRDDAGTQVAGLEAGANDSLAKPLDPQELPVRLRSMLARVRPAAPGPLEPPPRGRVVAVFGSNGGVGKTTVAVNTAIALQLIARRPVAIVDGDLWFGDIGVHLNLAPTRTIADLAGRGHQLDQHLLGQVLRPHDSGVQVLLSPPHPEAAETITPDLVHTLLGLLVERFTYTVVDCPGAYDDRTLATLEHADAILLVLTPEIGALKNASQFLAVADRLGLPARQIHVVLNRANSNVGVSGEEIERALRHRVAFRLPSGGRPVATSVNRGVPLIAAEPEHLLAREMVALARELTRLFPEGVPHAAAHSVR